MILKSRLFIYTELKTEKLYLGNLNHRDSKFRIDFRRCKNRGDIFKKAKNIPTKEILMMAIDSGWYLIVMKTGAPVLNL